MAAVYDDELNRVFDRLIPLRRVFRRRRPTDPWFDSECRAAKRLTRRLERAYAAACRRRAAADATVATRVALYDQRRAYRQLRQQKCRDFWAEKSAEVR